MPLEIRYNQQVYRLDDETNFIEQLIEIQTKEMATTLPLQIDGYVFFERKQEEDLTVYCDAKTSAQLEDDFAGKTVWGIAVHELETILAGLRALRPSLNQRYSLRLEVSRGAEVPAVPEIVAEQTADRLFTNRLYFTLSAAEERQLDPVVNFQTGEGLIEGEFVEQSGGQIQSVNEIKGSTSFVVIFKDPNQPIWYIWTEADTSTIRQYQLATKVVAMSFAVKKAVSQRQRVAAWVDGLFESLPEALTAAFLTLNIPVLAAHLRGLPARTWSYLGLASTLFSVPMAVMIRHWVLPGFYRLPAELAPFATENCYPKLVTAAHFIAPLLYAAAVVQAGLAVEMGSMQMLLTVGSQLCLQYMKSAESLAKYLEQNKLGELSLWLKIPMGMFKVSGVCEAVKNLWTPLEWMIHIIGYLAVVDTLTMFVDNGLISAIPAPISHIFSMTVPAILLGAAQTPFTKGYDIPKFANLSQRMGELLHTHTFMLKISRVMEYFFRELTKDSILQLLINGNLLNGTKALLFGPKLALAGDAVIKVLLGFNIGARAGIEAYKMLNDLEVVSRISLWYLTLALGAGYAVLNGLQSYGKWCAALHVVYDRIVMKFSHNILLPAGVLGLPLKGVQGCVAAYHSRHQPAPLRQSLLGAGEADRAGARAVEDVEAQHLPLPAVAGIGSEFVTNQTGWQQFKLDLTVLTILHKAFKASVLSALAFGIDQLISTGLKPTNIAVLYASLGNIGIGAALLLWAAYRGHAQARAANAHQQEERLDIEDDAPDLVRPFSWRQVFTGQNILLTTGTAILSVGIVPALFDVLAKKWLSVTFLANLSTAHPAALPLALSAVAGYILTCIHNTACHEHHGYGKFWQERVVAVKAAMEAVPCWQKPARACV